LESRFQAQIAERDASATNGSVKLQLMQRIVLHQQLHAATAQERDAFQARVWDLEAAASNRTSELEFAQKQLRINASLDLETMQSRCQLEVVAAQKLVESRFQSQLEGRAEPASNASTKLQAEQQQLHAFATQEKIILRARVQEMEVALDSGAQLRSITTLEQTAMQSRSQALLQQPQSCFHAPLQERNEARANATKANAALAELEKAHTQELEVAAAICASDFKVESEQLRLNATLEQEALQSRFQAQLQALEDIARTNATTCEAKNKELCAAAKGSAAQVHGEASEDLDKKCSVWAHAGKCDSSPEIMHVVCKKSCRSSSFDKALGAGWTLDPSKAMGCCCDFNEFCVEWAAQGQCESNPEFMLSKCQYSCGACGNRDAKVSR